MAFIPLTEIAANLQKSGRYWISFTGDSITSCEWVHPNWRDIVIYVLHDQLTDYLKGDWQTAEWGIKGFNWAYDGANTQNIVEKINDILLVKPHLVIGLMGGNDAPQGITVAQSVANIRKIADRVLASGAKLVWSNSTPAAVNHRKNKEYSPYARAFIQMSSPDPANFQKIDMFSIYQNFPLKRLFTFLSEENLQEGLKKGDPDPIHPNQLGNAYIAKVILDETFGISFDPEKYISNTQSGLKYPEY